MVTRWHRQVSERAYAIWESEGRRHDNDWAHWFQAAAETPIRVTFDSNEWEDVTCPDRCRDRPKRYSAVLKINGALRDGSILGFICEIVTTLEGVPKKARADFLAKQTPGPRVLECVSPDGTTSPIIIFAPDQSHRPALHPILIDNLREAQAIGIRVMSTMRYSELFIPSGFYADEPHELLTIWQVRSSIEERGVGRAKLHKFSLTLAAREPGGQVYFDIPNVPMTDLEQKKVAEYVAEWADSDAIACHVAYGNDFFCTEENNKKDSILGDQNKEWLTNIYGTRFVDLIHLAEMI
jgi:hypothetical protein